MLGSGLHGRMRWTRTEAIAGVASLGLFYWGTVAALVNHRLERQREAACHRSTVSMRLPPLRGPLIVPLPSTDWRGQFVRPEPAWAPYPQPQPLGLAYGQGRAILVDTGR
jgi:hypothetical protein